GDANHRLLLAMALLGAVARLGAVLEDDELLAAILAKNLAHHGGLGNDRGTDLRGLAIGNEQDAIEGDGLAGGSVEPLDSELAAQLNAILLAAGLDYCVHDSPRRLGPVARGQRREPK